MQANDSDAGARGIRKLVRMPDRRGANVLEFALVGFVFFAMIFGVADVSRYFLAWHGLNTVVSEAARASMVNNWTFACANPTSGTAATVAASAPFLNPSQMTLCVSAATANNVTTVTAKVSYPFAFIMAPLSVANGNLAVTTTLTY